MTIRRAVRAADVDHALGVASDLGNGNWTSVETMISQAKYAGVDVLRVGVPVAETGPIYRGHLKQLVEAGLKLDMVVDPRDTPANNADAISQFLSLHPGSIAFVEGPNEPNNWGVTYGGKTGVEGAQIWLAEFYSDMKANADTASLKIAGMSSWPPVAATSDTNNLHIYPNHGDQPGSYIEDGLIAQDAVDPGKPFVITELGWYTAPGLGDPGAAWSGVDEATHAKLVLNAYMDAARAGILSVGFYALRDWVFTDIGAHFGLFRSDDTPKPAATALHNVQSILGDTSSDATSFTPGALHYAMTASSDVKSMLMQQSDGDFILALWREPDVWDEAAQKALSPAGERVDLHFGVAVDAAIYDPLTGRTAASTADDVAGLSLTVTDHPLFVVLSGAPQEPAGTTIGSGARGLSLRISQDSWEGDASYTVKVDGQQIGGTLTAKALHATGQQDLVTVLGDWADGSHTLTVTFLNDAYGGTPSTDRNLYVDGISLDGTPLEWGTAALLSAGSKDFAFTAGTTIGTGADALVLRITQEAYQGSAQYVVRVDGQQIGGTLTASALLGSGKADTVTVRGDWAAGSHAVEVQFLNDAWGGTATADRNLHVESATYNGVAVPNSALHLLSAGTQSFSFTELASPPTGPQTIAGTEGPDTLTGTSRPDSLSGLAGNDVLRGGGSSDTLLGGDGNDRILGGYGDDVITLGAGRDVAIFNGSVGNRRTTHDGADRITDFVSGVDKLDIRSVASAADIAAKVVTGGIEVALATGGKVLLQGLTSLRAGDVTLNGKALPLAVGPGAPAPVLPTTTATVTGTAGADTLAGGTNADLLLGAAGNDTLSAGGSDDVLRGGVGADRLTGGAGKDVFVMARGDGQDWIVDFTPGQDRLWLEGITAAQVTQVAETRSGTSGMTVSLGSGDEFFLARVTAKLPASDIVFA